MEFLLASVVWWKTTIVQVLGFAVLFGILFKWVFPFVGGILKVRRKGFQDTFERLEREQQETTKKLEEVKATLTRKEEEGEKRIMKALKEGTQAKKNAIKEAGTSAREILDRATRDIDIERDKAILELRNEITRLTLRASREVASQMVTPEVQSRLVQKYLEDLEEVRS